MKGIWEEIIRKFLESHLRNKGWIGRNRNNYE